MTTRIKAGMVGDSGTPALRCQGAVIRAYENLRTAGVKDEQAFLAAARLYRTHHPEDGMKNARLRVAGWIYDRPSDS